MILRDQLNELKKKGVQNIKLGSGSAFVYCGKISAPGIGLVSAKAKRNAEIELGNRTRFMLDYPNRRKELIRAKMAENINRWLDNSESGSRKRKRGIMAADIPNARYVVSGIRGAVILKRMDSDTARDAGIEWR